jgi:hypothetical protein
MLRRLCVALTLAILMLAALAQGAAADPINSKNSSVFPATCDGQEVLFVVTGIGNFSPAHVVGSTAVLIPESFDVIIEFTPPGGPTQTQTFTGSKPNPHGEVSCSADVSETTPEGTFRLVATATGFFTPAS